MGAYQSKKVSFVSRKPVSERMPVPYLGNFNDIRSVAVPKSGMERASWYASDMARPSVAAGAGIVQSMQPGMTPRSPRRPRAARAAASYAHSAMPPRGINGAERDQEISDVPVPYASVYPEPESRSTASLASFWSAQIRDGADEDPIYVDKDSASVWA